MRGDVSPTEQEAVGELQQSEGAKHTVVILDDNEDEVQATVEPRRVQEQFAQQQEAEAEGAGGYTRLEMGPGSFSDVRSPSNSLSFSPEFAPTRLESDPYLM